MDASITAAVARARAAQPGWAARPIRERAALLRRARRVLIDRQEAVAALVAREVGKPTFEAVTGEIIGLADLLSHLATAGPGILRGEGFSLAVFRHKRSAVSYEPLGVVGIISPGNFPLSIPGGEVAQSLLAGNAVVLKPSERTPGTAEALRDLFAAAGLPAGVLEVVHGNGGTGAALVEADIDKLFFTGSVGAGRRIAEAAGRRLLPVILELGGKDPMIVCTDAPYARTVRGAVWGAFMNAGQACAGVERLYVVAPLAERFTADVVAATRRLRLGPPGPDVDVGPLASPGQLAVVEAHVADAVARGARVLCGGRARPDLGPGFYEPTVLADVTPAMRVMTEETFGPVLPIRVVPDEEAAVTEANASPYGLSASIWTTSTRRGRALAARLVAGTITINDVLYTHAAGRAPWFGVKASGAGSTHGTAGLRGHARMKHVNWDRLPLPRNPWWFPYTPRAERAFRALNRLLYRFGLRRWL